MQDDMRNRVQQVLRCVFPAVEGTFEDAWGPDQIDGWDSMEHLNLVMALGKEFEIALDFEEVMAIGTVGDIFSVLEKRGIK